MTDIPMKMTWKGQDVETLHRDVLIEIIHQLHRELDATRRGLLATIAIDQTVRKLTVRGE